MMLPVEVMPVARKPDVFVRAVTPEEGRKLAQIARRSKQPIRMRRAVVVVMASAQHQSVRVDREADAGVGIVCAAGDP
ncbi:hypothetical protein [Nocardia abscessus]|uniref:hypothetical protein n=1 Tax=Nocardia abscessus TaxID=120957 RepID=UPI001E3B405D|nr:hypothetical protein [Nocardia abscessus]